MKIAVFVAGNGKSGAPRRLALLAHELSRNGEEVSFVCGADHEIVPFALGLDLNIHYLWKPRCIDSGFRAKSVIGKVFTLLSIVTYQIYLWWVLTFVYPYDVIVKRSTVSGISHLAIFFLRKTSVILDIDFELENSTPLKLARYISLNKSKAVVLQYAAVINDFFNDHQAEIIRKKSIAIVPGINTHIQDLPIKNTFPGKAFTLLMVGTISPRKNQKLILESLSIVIKRNPGLNIKLRLVGEVADMRYKEALDILIASEGLCGYVEFVGWSDQIPLEMQKSSLLVMSSINEGVPNTVQEAMINKLPVLVSAVGGNPDIVLNDKTGWIINDFMPENWANKILSLVNSQSLLNAISENAYEYASTNFSSEVYGKKYIDFIRASISADI